MKSSVPLAVLLLGATPVMGYRINPNLALQAGYNYLIPKASEQRYSESVSNVVYQ